VADIDVVKKGSSAWVWVLVVLALIVLLWIVWASVGTEETPGATGASGRDGAPIALGAIEWARLAG